MMGKIWFNYHRKGFTLIELLVVISIIALLLSILMPSLRKARQQAQLVVCQANLRQAGIAVNMYTTNNNDRFFAGYLPPGSNVNAANFWIGALRPYYKDQKVLCCPTATKTEYRLENGAMVRDRNAGTFTAWGVFCGPGDVYCQSEGDYGSFGFNEWVSDPQPEDYGSLNYSHPNPDSRWRRSTVAGGNKIPLLMGCNWVAAAPWNSFDMPPRYEGESWTSCGMMGKFCMNRHNGYNDAIFLDLSARKVGLKELWTLKWSRTFDTKGIWTSAGGVSRMMWPEWMRDFKDY